MTSYPPEPWHLRGQLYLSVLRVPLADVPVDLPPGCRPVRLGRFGVVGTAWVSYEPGGVLTYRELMATVLVRRGRRLLPTIVSIWVDSEQSLHGGRELWGIPKDLASFEQNGGTWTASADGRRIATGLVAPRMRVPGRWPVAFSVVQWLAGRAAVSPVRVRASLVVAAARFTADADGPLGYLAGRRPLVSLSLNDFAMTFGT